MLRRPFTPTKLNVCLSPLVSLHVRVGTMSDIGPNDILRCHIPRGCRKVDGAAPSDLDALIDRNWHLHEYLDAPGLIRKGEPITRREVIKHMANEMGGVHVGGRNLSVIRDLLTDAESHGRSPTYPNGFERSCGNTQ